ncbi:cysteine desulfurase family protein [Alicyclobacillus suci]|uniref:cysteine desulfurase family protein n=1 Tax=Alicyclobacillus suci TaxID=2816080 RepID=UPI001A8C83DF|nr:cysteine desulfurase family protein [Alicyclobacillus suci]
MPEKTIYLDYASTSPLLEDVKQRVSEMLDVFGNPSSLHRIGMAAEERLSTARTRVLKALGAKAGRLVFTGGGTEANNLAVFGSLALLEGRGRHIVTTAIEHPAVLEPIRTLEKRGWEVTYIRPDGNGDIQVNEVLEAIRPDTVFVSMMHVNNETGAILPVVEVAKALTEYPKIRFHVDGTQAFGKIPVRLADTAIDLYTVSAHKIGALKGTGGLYVRPGIKLEPILYGGGQELGTRSGTENVLGADVFGLAAEIAVKRLEAESNALATREWFVDELERIPGWTVRKPKSPSPYIVNASLKGLRGEVIVHALESQGVYVSSGSACSTAHGKQKRSHVLEAMGLSTDEVDAAVRFSWHPGIDREDLASALTVVREQSSWLRSMVGA